MKKPVSVKFGILFVITALIMCGVFNYAIDPHFHYHKPLSILEYPIMNERYQNYGMIKNFDYDAIITGTSMCENFKNSEYDELFNVKSIPLYCSGGYFKEINDQLVYALKNNENIKSVIRGLDYGMLAVDANYTRDDLPEYLFDNNVFNDVKYLLNKDTLLCSFSVLLYTLRGNKTTEFDYVANWMDEAEYGKDVLDSIYHRGIKESEKPSLSESDIELVKDNIYENVVKTALEYPNVDFYYFLTPYSIYFFDSAYVSGSLNNTLQIEEITIREILKADNIHLFSFFLCEESIIDNLDNYRDTTHYCEWINSDILKYMKNGEYQITKDNVDEYINNEHKYFMEYDFDVLFE